MKYEPLILIGIIVVGMSDDNLIVQAIGTLIIGIPVLIKLREEYKEYNSE